MSFRDTLAANGLLPARKPDVGTSSRLNYPISLNEYIALINGTAYQLGLNQTWTQGDKTEPIGVDFQSLVQSGYAANGVIFACMLARLALFSEARFQFRQIRNGRPGDLFGNAELRILEEPWPNGTTGDLLARAITDVDLAGNFYCRRAGDTLQRMRPDWVSIVLGSKSDSDDPGSALDAVIAGYIYYPGGKKSGKEPVPLLREQVAHFAPIPDPMARFRGMSWLAPIANEIMADTAATRHKQKFFDNAGTPNLVVKLDPSIRREDFNAWVEIFNANHTGVENAYKTLFLGAGADTTIVGQNFQQMEFKVTQGAGETRIAAAAGVPPVIVGLSEGLQAATYSNYGQARRRYADLTMRPLWRNFAGSMSTVVNVPGASELWYDDRDISFLKEDLKDVADILQVRAQTIRTLIEAGFEANSVVDAVDSGDMARLKHTGLFSVQLQAPGSTKMPSGEAPGELPVGGAATKSPTKQPMMPMKPAGNGALASGK